MITPFIHSIKLGELLEGTYNISMVENPEVTTKIEVNRSTTESPDEFFYAPVDSAQIIVDSESGRQSLRVQGMYPITIMGCLKMQEVRTTYSNNVLVVQPIMEFFDGEACEDHKLDFEVDHGLSEPLKEGSNLLHVRVISGNSYNRHIKL
jgi:hypothetical protein